VAQAMTIYSWNMLFRNQEQDRAFAFIRDVAFDIFCLQEVPDEFLARLKTLPFHLASGIDVDRFFSHRVRNHLVILSRYPISARGVIPLPDYWTLLPWRARLFIRLMRSFNFSRTENRHGLFADVETPAGLVRVFDLHLTLAHPRWRIEEFETALAGRVPGRPTIVCGDFNILESPKITILNWFLGGRMTDVVRYRRERMRIEARFVEHKLVNPLYGRPTHPLSRSQLDHILVSRSFSVKDAAVLSDRAGSDHHPISVTLA